MVTIEEVKAFLELFNIKAQVFGIRYRNDRGKNRETLLQLDISPMQRELIVKNLQVQDYVEGPVIDILNKEEKVHYTFSSYCFDSLFFNEPHVN